MQLYQPRGFNDFFQDTFTFLKINGKHFFKHYFIVNGFFLLILMVIGYFFSKFYTDFVFGGLINPNNSPTYIDEYFNENFGLFALLVFIFFIVSIVAGIISYAYTPIYFTLYNKHQGASFSTQEIITHYKHHAGKIITFLLCSILLAIPVFIGLGISLFILFITIIGILATPFIIGLVLLFYGMTLMEYLEEKKSIWDCFGYSWTLITSKFWAAIGAIGLFLLMSYIIQIIVTIISSIFNTVNILTGIEDQSLNPDDLGGTSIILTLFLFVLSFLISTILGNIIQINQGIIFYGLKEQKENIHTKSIIDDIGTHED